MSIPGVTISAASISAIVTAEDIRAIVSYINAKANIQPNSGRTNIIISITDMITASDSVISYYNGALNSAALNGMPIGGGLTSVESTNIAVELV